jgi:hypothetical protein
MANIQVLGASPVSFVSEVVSGSSEGVQYQIPLSALGIKADGTVDRGAWAPAGVSGAELATLLSNLDAFLKDLLARGVIWPKPAS